MIFKDLKELVMEANEIDPTVAEENGETKEEKTEKPRKPKSDVQAVKDASDGVGNETYSISNSIATTLETDLTEYYNIKKIEASNNKITITADIKKMKTGLLTSKMTGDPIQNEKLLDIIQQIIIADVGEEISKFTLNGPLDVAPGVLVITVVPVTE